MTNNGRLAHVVLALSALLVVLAIACGDSNPTSPGSTPAVSTGSTTGPGTGTGGTGTLRVMLKDSPFGEASAVLVTFDGVSVHMSGGGWQPLTIDQQPVALTCDLKKLEGPQALLGTAVLTAGHYTQIRLVVDRAAIYNGGATPSGGPACVVAADEATLAPTAADPSEVVPSAVAVPSGEIKLNREFDLPADGAVLITLDFDGEKSISQTGNGKYMMKPVIGIVSVVVQP